MQNKLTTLLIDLSQQRLQLLDETGTLLGTYPVSTGARGAGELTGSQQTPRGWHRIHALIGKDEPPGAVFVARQPTGEIYSPALAAQHPSRDWILSRIVWLDGLEPGFNLGGSVGTLQRYIYLHGTPDSEPMGQPASHGCIRMRNEDLIALFPHLTESVRVHIVAQRERAQVVNVDTQMAAAYFANQGLPHDPQAQTILLQYGLHFDGWLGGLQLNASGEITRLCATDVHPDLFRRLLLRAGLTRRYAGLVGPAWLAPQTDWPASRLQELGLQPLSPHTDRFFLPLD
ncbi:L,D-transpeptidase [Leeia aquatica]|uniref:L,D-transpeptidase n=1 Tax=Leeia aquatica TaxID=2725557 RepID=UPI001F0F8D1B|nr:L,D-transpeptidase [Leeia aquatica]